MEGKGRGRGWSCSELEERSVQSEMEAGEMHRERKEMLRVCYYSRFQTPLSFPCLRRAWERG